MSTILSLPEELIIEIMVKGDYKMLLACQKVCRMLYVIIKDSLALQYIILLAACGMQDGLSTALCQRTADLLQRLSEHEAAWRELAWSDGGVLTHQAACDLPTAISGGVLAFLKQSRGDPSNPELGDRLFLLRIPSKMRGIPGECWELNGLGEMSNLCIDSAQDLLLFHRLGKFHVRALSSGNVHPLVLHSGVFDTGVSISEYLAETPVVCCDHLAAVVREDPWTHSTPIVKGTLIVWNWRTGNRVAVLQPSFARICSDIAFLDETHLLIPASAVDSRLNPGQSYELMLLVVDFEPSATRPTNETTTTPYCFHVALPVRTGPATFRHPRISVNTASFSPPTDPSARGYFHADAKDRIIALEVTDNNWLQGREETAELYAPASTFLTYIARAESQSTTTTMTTTRGAHVPRASANGPVDVPWEVWGPHGAKLVRANDQTYIIRRPRACGMRVLGAPLSNKSVVVSDYHPGRVARSANINADPTTETATTAAANARSRALGTFSEPEPERTQSGVSARRARARCPPLVCVTKEVSLPQELQEASESPWTMLCEDALLAFEYVPDGFEISRVFAYTF